MKPEFQTQMYVSRWSNGSNQINHSVTGFITELKMVDPNFHLMHVMMENKGEH